VLADWLNSNATRSAAYAVAGLACLHAWTRARRHGGVDTDEWPALWLGAAGLLLAMALGRIVDAERFVTEFGRSTARSEGWYGSRRSLQVALFVVVSIAGGVLAYRVVSRMRKRRRQYLLTAVAVSGLALFAAVRFVSLHSVDSVLHRRPIWGVRIVTIAELALVVVTTVSALGHPRPPADRAVGHASRASPRDVTP
jgi:hypothetical protein